MSIKMRTLLVTLVCLMALTSELVWSGSQHSASESHSSGWLQFKRQYGKVYPTREEEAARFAIYLRNKQLVGQHNANKSHTFTLGINQMSDWTDEEFARMSRQKTRPLGNVATSDEIWAHLGANPYHRSDFPADFDWRSVSGRVSSVKDQGNCSAGWAFAVTGLMEGQQQVMNSSKGLVELSTQQLIDCASFNQGCSGGAIESAFDNLKQWGGLESEADYKYVAKDQACHMDKDKFVQPVIDYLNYFGAREEFVKQVLFLGGPVAVSLDADYFRHYKGGIFELEPCPYEAPNHSLLIVGYGSDLDQGDYWIVKNSWGTSWGESGYMRIRRGVNMCGIVSYVVVPKS